MCNPATQQALTEGLPLLNALIAEAERNIIDVHSASITANPDGRFTIWLQPYDGAGQALADLFDLDGDVIFTSDGVTYQGHVRRVGRWTIRSQAPLLAAEEAAA